jgi:hypothetical protein
MTHAWVEGHQTGLPVKELIKAAAPIPAGAPFPAQHKPSIDPRVGIGLENRTPPAKGTGMRHEVFALAEGDVTIQWPEKLSQDSFTDLEEWLVILQRKIKRNITSDTGAAQGAATKADDQ